MMNVLDSLLGGDGQKYMHLVPTTEEPLEWMDVDDEDMDTVGDEEYAYTTYYDDGDSWMGFAMNTARGCHQKMKDWLYGGDSDGDVVYIEDVEFVQDGETVGAYSQPEGEGDDLLVIQMTAIMVLIVLCGVLYVGYRCLVERKEKLRMEDYVAMHDDDQF